MQKEGVGGIDSYTPCHMGKDDSVVPSARIISRTNSKWYAGRLRERWKVLLSRHKRRSIVGNT